LLGVSLKKKGIHRWVRKKGVGAVARIQRIGTQGAKRKQVYTKDHRIERARVNSYVTPKAVEGRGSTN